MTTLRYAHIRHKEDLQQSWTAPELPHMSFSFDQEEIQDCIFQDGKYYASYRVQVIEEPRDIEYHDISTGKMTKITVPPGTYGLRHEDDLTELPEAADA